MQFVNYLTIYVNNFLLNGIVLQQRLGVGRGDKGAIRSDTIPLKELSLGSVVKSWSVW